MIKVALLFAALFAAVLAQAEPIERVVWGQVTKVEPIVETTQPAVPRGCPLQKPPPGAALEALLSWDLDLSCQVAPISRVVAYVVEYHWDGRAYSLTMDQHPGNRVPLVMKVR